MKMSKNNFLFVKRFSQVAIIPTRATLGSAGLDLYSPVNALILCGEHVTLYLDIGIQMPEGTYGRIADRSGLALKGISVLGGVIDSDFRGNVGVILFNHSKDKNFEVKIGDRIAQLIVEKITYPLVAVVEELTRTARQEGGFGSTGLNALVMPLTQTNTATENYQPVDMRNINAATLKEKDEQKVGNSDKEDTKEEEPATKLKKLE